MSDRKLPVVLSNTQTALVLEDEEVIRMLAVEVLSSMGFRVLEADNAQDAAAILRTEKIDLAWFDNNVPVKKGSEVNLKKNEGAALLHHPKRPKNCLLSSGHGTTDDFEVPADVYNLPKPATMAQAEAAITALYKQNGQELNISGPAESAAKDTFTKSIKPDAFLPKPVTWEDKTFILVQPHPAMAELQTAWVEKMGVQNGNIHLCRDIFEASEKVGELGGYVDVIVSNDRAPQPGDGSTFIRENDDKFGIKVLLTGGKQPGNKIPGANNSYVFHLPCSMGDYQQLMTGAAEIAARTQNPVQIG